MIHHQTLIQAWHAARMEALESGRSLQLHLDSHHHGGEFLPLQGALHHFEPDRFRAMHCTLSMGGVPTAWLLANLALSSGQAQTQRQETRPTILWTGPTAGLEACCLNITVPEASFNALAQDAHRDPPHIQHMLTAPLSPDRAYLEKRHFMLHLGQRPRAPAMAHARSDSAASTITAWTGFLFGAVLLLSGLTRFLLGFF